MDRIAHLLRVAPTHVLMVAVMAATIALHSTLASLAGAAVLVAASMLCAALSRGYPFLREHIVDLWAMALVIVAFLPHGLDPAPGHHALAIPSAGAFAAIVAAWAAVRVWLAVGREVSEWRVAVASGAFTAAGLAVMALFCA